MHFLDRPLAITDVETTGLDPEIHEIIEIGLVLVNQRTLEIIEKLNIWVKPEHLDRASERALEVNGYNERIHEWDNAVTLEEAMKLYAEKTEGALCVAHNAVFDGPFIKAAFKRAGVENPMDYHVVCQMSVAWNRLGMSGLEKLKLSEIAKFLGLPPEPEVHRAINGAMLAYEVLKRMRGVETEPGVHLLEKAISARVYRFSDATEETQALLADARDARRKAQAPYSHYRVGASILAEDGTYHLGCNVERCSYTQTTHAEQSAVDGAVRMQGPIKVRAVAIVAAPEAEEVILEREDGDPYRASWSGIGAPCGHCLQIIWENCGGDPNVKLYSFGRDGLVYETTMGDALPMPFGPEALGIDVFRGK